MQHKRDVKILIVFLLAAVVMFYHNHSFSQVLERTIEWQEVKTSEKSIGTFAEGEILTHLRFENVVYPDQESMLPYFYEVFPAASHIRDSKQIRVFIEKAYYEPLSEMETEIVKSIPKEGVERQSVDFGVYQSRGTSYIYINIPTISFSQTTGQPQKLVRFDIRVEETGNNEVPKSTNRYSIESVLAQGKWVMIRINQTGIHKISYSELVSMGLTNLQNVSVWGHGGKQLPFWNNQPSIDDLEEIPIWVETGNDGVFNQGDNIFFYAQGPVTWEYSNSEGMFIHKTHDYAQQIHYFVTTSTTSPRRVPVSSNPSESHTFSSTSYDALVFFEKNDTNLIKSGRRWFGESFDIYSTRSYSAGLGQPVAGGIAKIKLAAAARSGVSSSFTLRANGNSLGTMSLPAVSLSSQYLYFASISEKIFTMPFTQGSLNLELEYNKPTPAAIAWLDYIVVNARQRLLFGNQQLDFRDTESVGEGTFTLYSISNAPSNLRVWDITSLHNPEAMSLTNQSGTATFKRESSVVREYVAFTTDQAKSVSVVGDVANQNIHGEAQPEMVIVTHPNFYSHAQELAQIHFDNSGLRSLIVTNQQVYNEFSSGNPDVSAIRNMMRMFYKRAASEQEMPRYLLLFGDGSYDNLSQTNSNTNYILTYQSENSTFVSSSFVSDDYYGLLDDNEGEATGFLDVGIGRIPCNTPEEAKIAVAKIRQYLHQSSLGSWHNQLCFIGDDGDSNLHMDQADQLAKLIQQNHPTYNIDRIFFDAYPLVTTALGARYPEVTNSINNRANLGTLIMNYTGHANARWLAHERVLMISDILSWRNYERLPLFVTATCEFSRFDDYAWKSAGEHSLFAPLGGAVGLVSTSRVVYAPPNFTLNRNFLSVLFSKNEQIRNGDTYYRLGDALMIAKRLSGTQTNKRNFLLIGDPALMLHYPELKLDVSEINGSPVTNSLDTLKALSRVEVKGRVTGSRLADGFQGEAELILFDKERDVTTLRNTGGMAFNFTTRTNTIYKGRMSVVDGEFTSTFIIPKDIMYSYGNGRFSLFAHNGMITGSGFFEDFIIGGISGNLGDDSIGPEIDIYMNDKKFVSGGVTDSNPKLLVFLADSSGINTTGTGIGHDLTASISGEVEVNYVLNDYYTADLDSYQSGKAEYQLSSLRPGNYSVKVKAWDVYNNSSENSIDFTVKSNTEIVLEKVLNYPNPFTESTGFYFEHNQAYEPFDVMIQIFSPSGKLVKTIEYFYPGNGTYRVGPIAWDGLDDFGDRIGRGVYFYRLRVRLSDGRSAQVYQKLVILK